MPRNELTAPAGAHCAERKVPVGDGEIHVREWGDRSAEIHIVAVHGQARSSAFMTPLAEAILAGGRAHIIAPDLRNHGDSARMTSGIADDVFGRDLYLVWERTVGKAAIWYGESLGARAVTMAVAQWPQCARMVVLGEALLCEDPRELELLVRLSRARHQRSPRAFSSRAEARQFAENHGQLAGRGLELWLDHGLEETDDGFLVEKFHPGFLAARHWPPGGCAFPKVRQSVAKLDVPIWLIYSMHESAASESKQLAIRGIFFNAHIKRLEGAGHDLGVSRAATLAQALWNAARSAGVIRD